MCEVHRVHWLLCGLVSLDSMFLFTVHCFVCDSLSMSIYLV